jgi:predicted DNA-binding antitoxin AbrB/MazE fold protein
MWCGKMMEAKTIEVVYEDGVFKPLGKLELATGTKVTFEITDTALLRERLKKYMGLLKVKVSSAELNELYHEYVTERTDIP